MTAPSADDPPDRVETPGAGSSLIRLVYTSQADKPPSPLAIEEILRASRRWNEADRLSGLLVHHQTHYMQCLEGPPEKVYATLERIRRDPRHHDVTVRHQQPIMGRAFGSWYMAYAAIGQKTWTMLARVDWGQTESYTFTDDPQASALPRGFALLERVWEMYRNTLQADRGPPEH